MENTSKQIMPFCFGDNLVRVIEDKNGDPWFVAKDVCKALEIEWKGSGNLGYLDDDERSSEFLNTPGGQQEMVTISESGLYALVFRSRKPEAKAFSKWVRSEVLPTLRKTGRYEMPGRGKTRSNYSLPPEMLQLSLNLKPAMRQRLWRDSLDTVRLDGGGFEAACQCFASLCGMMAQSRKLPDGPAMIFRFMDECLESAKGFNTPGHRIYDLFRLWWDENCEGAAPGRKSFAGYLQTRFQAYKSSVMVYRNCRIRHWQFTEA